MKKGLLAVICGLLLSNVLQAQVRKEFDFSGVCSSGQTLYYKILDEQTKNRLQIKNTPNAVSVTYPYGEQTSVYCWGWDGYAKPEGNLAIPAKVSNNGIEYKVVCIGGSSFEKCDKITSVTIPNTVSEIEPHAFYKCSSLKSVVLPNSVKKIGNWAFCETGLKTLQLPNSLTKIGDHVFGYCHDLESVTLPSNIKEISSCAFFECFNLKSVTIPNSLKKINGGFECCYTLQVTVPSTVTEVGYGSFRDCLNVNYHGNLEGAPWGAKCLNGYWEGNLLYKDKTKKYLVGCKRSDDITKVTIPNTVVEIGEGVFKNMTTLKTIIIGNSVRKIGDEAFLRDGEGWIDTEIQIPLEEPIIYGKSVFVSNEIDEDILNNYLNNGRFKVVWNKMGHATHAKECLTALVRAWLNF